jgi:hypothetical protein
MTETGFTALSVDIRTKRATPCFDAMSASVLGVHLDHRHVLVGGRVEDDGRLPLSEDLVHLLPVAYVHHERNDFRSARGDCLAHAPVDLVERVFAALRHEDPRCARGCDLSDDLGADRTACARDHDGPSDEELRSCGVVERPFASLQEVVVTLAGAPVDAP